MNQETIINYIILALAIFRLAHMVSWEDGVLGLCSKLREKLGVESFLCVDNFHYEDNNLDDLEPVVYWCEGGPNLQHTFLAIGIKCTWCVSFWLSLLFYILYVNFPEQTIFICIPIALNALAIWFNKLIS